jgi:hypothetical protein
MAAHVICNVPGSTCSCAPASGTNRRETFVLKIYADFNALVAGCVNPARTAVVLDTFGSLRDLCNAGVVLREGLPLIAVDASDDVEDLEGHGTAQFDRNRQWWLIELDEVGVRYVPAGDRTQVGTFLCIGCRMNLQPMLRTLRTVVDARCPTCGTSIAAAYAPP